MSNTIFKGILKQLNNKKSEDDLTDQAQGEKILVQVKRLLAVKSVLKLLPPNVMLATQLMQDYYAGHYRAVSKQFLMSLLAAFIYLISPVDFLPDVFPLIGFSDDAAVFLFVFKKFKRELADYQTWRNSSDKKRF
ncbi:MAG: DUF1232 domain-containing protein [Neisseriaceae bacterium]|nr:DUF1232 domain-containing protein [Neisseriaceae bacterium]